MTSWPELLVRHGRTDEAIEQTRAHPEGDTWYAAWAWAGLPDEAGRTEETDAVLAQHPAVDSPLRAERLTGHARPGRRSPPNHRTDSSGWYSWPSR
ncbi:MULTISPECIES: hypothetical protein [Streptomyces]|uniref:Uncharacterized protein n=1 Tax=Streptomyces odorifer TaxID=53450 RepID=A0A7Y6C550_9ACTN|nr:MULTISPECIES: hypothetical protein [Streptomyces]NUV34690.1 hypothetical protein [Streptomyces sp. KAI-27]NUV47982.1 hypothetical protein [Streptomyces sp. CAI-78]MBL0801898.1 hypothetical protein [Streptomyces albidoflavus]MCG5118175.1 hypothetical protein [Streptomyces sp. T7(2022)]MCK2140116.1 hypothetical protein [Streptomyces sp. WAC00276]